MNGRLFLGSLVVLAVLSGAVVAEAERNYAAVSSVETTDARVVSASVDDGGMLLTIAVDNEMGERLRVQYVHLSVQWADGSVSASVPYNGYETLPPGESRLSPGIGTRQFESLPEPGETVVVDGYVAVEVYNGYRFEVPIAEREVTL